MDFPAPLPVPEIEIKDPILDKARVCLTIRREDLNHPELSGNKFWKLKYNLLEAHKTGHTTILTFGGAFSNHIAATAAACRISGLKSIGIIRGEDADITNPTLSLAEKNGMSIHRINRSAYRRKSSDELLLELKNRFGNFYVIPEGGTNQLALAGIKEMVTYIRTPFDFLALPVGTGGTIVGCIQALKGESSILGFAALKGDFLGDEIKSLHNRLDLPAYANWSMVNEYHFGGYGKTTAELLNFIRDFEASQKIPLDQVYTGKMVFGLFKMIEEGRFEKGSVIMAIHTGGLQGRSSI